MEAANQVRLLLPTNMKVLVLNSGSSSQKSSLFEIGAEAPQDPPPPLWEGTIEWPAGEASEDEAGEPEAVMRVRTSRGAEVLHNIKATSRKRAIAQLLDTLWSGHTRVISGPAEIEAVGHRVVHGGPNYREPVLIAPEVKSAIAQFAFVAPLHNRAELGGMDLIRERLGAVPQVAVFDTAFHSQMPDAAYVYPGPYDWLAQGIRRYGFHGINHQYCAERAAQLLDRDVASLKIVTCHLGNGCSLAAIRDGHSIDTTMGFTPLEGLMMGTRSGSVDPGILTYLTSMRGVSGQRMDEVLNAQSGLLGISGVSSDMRQVEEAMKQGNARAKLAFDIFVHRLQSCIGAMIAVLGGFDALVFTAGIGEHSPEVRAAACANFGYVGLRIDSGRNAQASADADISAGDSRVRVLVIHAQEDWAIARHCQRLLKGIRVAPSASNR
jgi:acetate kinase